MLEWVFGGLVVFTTATAVAVMARSVLAMRAKIRLKFQLGRLASTNRELDRLIQKATAGSLDAEEKEIANKFVINAVKYLDQNDKIYVDEGLHQQNPIAISRYMNDLVTGH